MNFSRKLTASNEQSILNVFFVDSFQHTSPHESDQFSSQMPKALKATESLNYYIFKFFELFSLCFAFEPAGRRQCNDTKIGPQIFNCFTILF